MSNLKIGSTTTLYNVSTVNSNVSSTTTRNVSSTTTSQTPSITIKSNESSSNTATITPSTTINYGASSTQSAINIISSTTINTTSTTPNIVSSTTPNVVSSTTPNVVSSTTPNIASSTTQSYLISSETLKPLTGDDMSIDKVEKVLDNLRRGINQSARDRINEIIDNNINIKDGARIFDVEYENPTMSFNYYADLKAANTDGLVSVEVNKSLQDGMNNLINLEDITMALGNVGVEKNIGTGEFYLQGTYNNTTVKLNLNKMISGEFNIIVENTSQISNNGKVNAELTVGMELSKKVDRFMPDDAIEEEPVPLNDRDYSDEHLFEKPETKKSIKDKVIDALVSTGKVAGKTAAAIGVGVVMGFSALADTFGKLSNANCVFAPIMFSPHAIRSGSQQKGVVV